MRIVYTVLLFLLGVILKILLIDSTELLKISSEAGRLSLLFKDYIRPAWFDLILASYILLLGGYFQTSNEDERKTLKNLFVIGLLVAIIGMVLPFYDLVTYDFKAPEKPISSLYWVTAIISLIYFTVTSVLVEKQ